MIVKRARAGTKAISARSDFKTFNEHCKPADTDINYSRDFKSV